MKFRIKFIGVAAALGVLACGSAFALAQTNQANIVSVEAAATVKTISEICGFNRVAGNNSKTYIAISAKESIGTYGASYVGTVYDAAGNPLSLTLKQNGGASGSWIGEGTRRFELKTDDSAFLEGIGSGTTFYITKDTVFEGSDCNIVFAKEYKFSSIYDGGCTIAEFAPTTAGLAIAEVETRLSGTQYRVGVNSFSGISAGFGATYQGTALDRNGNEVTVTLKDAGNGNTSAGNRRALINLSSAISGNILIFPKGMVWTSTTDFSARLSLGDGYRINAQTAGQYEVDHFADAADYCQKLLATITCDANGASAPTIAGGWTKWSECALALSSSEKALIKAGSSNENIANFVSLYSYVAAKYGYADYLGLGVSASPAKTVSFTSKEGSILAVAGVATLAAVAGSAIILKGRRKKQ